MSRLRIAVIGCGHLGKIHAKLISQNPNAQLVAVVDPVSTSVNGAAEEFETMALESYEKLASIADAAIIAAPTGFHWQIANDLMREGLDLLIEKPMTATAAESTQLSDLATALGRTVAVGHVERFNPAFHEAQDSIRAPAYIESSRCSGFTFRSIDVGVVMDLMIHDLELVLSLVGSRVEHIQAWGQSVISNHEDIAMANLTFANGCRATLKASRVSPEAERRMDVYEPKQHTTIDFAARTMRQVGQCSAVSNRTFDVEQLTGDQIGEMRRHVFDALLPTTQSEAAATNPLADEQQDFIDSVVSQREPRVSHRAAGEAVRVAEQIVRLAGTSHTLPRIHRPAA